MHLSISKIIKFEVLNFFTKGSKLMALSDVTVEVNLAQRTGVESDWFPL
jgi:hypothetical protein